MRITASRLDALSFTSSGSGIVASTTSRTLSGELVPFATCRAISCSCCAYGRTSVGRLKVAAGAIRIPTEAERVKLTEEHHRDRARGHGASFVQHTSGIRAAMRVSDGPLGDAALTEAMDHTRDAFSFDVVDAAIDGDTLVDALLIAVGQVGIPAFDDMRIDSVAASQTQQHTGNTNGRNTMTEAQRERLRALRAMTQDTRTPEQQAELDQLAALEAGTAPAAQPEQTQPAQTTTQTQQPAAAATQQVAASVPSVPAGAPRAAATTRDVDPLGTFVRTIVDGYRNNDPRSITAALNDVTHTQHSDNVSAPGWSGELWSGLQYEPEFTPMLNSGDLTSFEGRGWRWVTKPEMADYAGDKAAIPTNTPDTEPATYEAARMAVGHNIDRKFYDFPDEGFLRSYVEAVRESWAMKLDGKVEAYILANAVAATIGGVAVPAQTSLLAAVNKALRSLKRNRVGRASFVILSDNDYDTLMDITTQEVPAFLELYGIDPKQFTSSGDQVDGTVTAGVKQAATVRTLPGSPIRASAQHIANGGIDEGFFGYWAVEEHHTSGIVKVTYA